MTPLATLVRRRRHELGLTTAELGSLLHTTYSTVEKVERAFCMIKLDNAMRWCRALRLEPQVLLEAAERSVRVR